MKINKILISPQEFKESLTGLEVAKAMDNGIHNFDNNIETILYVLCRVFVREAMELYRLW